MRHSRQLMRWFSVKVAGSCVSRIAQPQPQFSAVKERICAVSCSKMHSFASLLHRFKKRPYQIVAPGVVSPVRTVPDSIPKPPYAVHGSPAIRAPPEPEVKSEEQIEGMRRACALAAAILKFAGENIQVGMTTDELDGVIHEECISKGAYPSPLLYQDFPKSVCTSINNVACHGIPDHRQLCDGDIMNVDITVYFEGYHGDCSATFMVGTVDEAGQKLISVARRCRDVGVSVCRPGAHFREIGQAISECAAAEGCSVIPEFCGHGIGSYFHGPPEIIHVDYPYKGTMQPGITFTIEPIISEGSDDIKILSDNWTAVSVDNSRSAQFEHTVLITSTGVDILTL